MAAAFISPMMGVPVETVVPRLAVPSAPAGTLGPLQPRVRGWRLLNSMMPGGSTPAVFGVWLAGSHRKMQTIIVDSFGFFDLSRSSLLGSILPVDRNVSFIFDSRFSDMFPQ